MKAHQIIERIEGMIFMIRTAQKLAPQLKEEPANGFAESVVSDLQAIVDAYESDDGE